MPFANEPGSITVLRSNLCERWTSSRSFTIVGGHAGVLWIQPGDHRGATGGADRRRGIRPRANHSFVRDAIDIRCFNDRVRPPHLGLIGRQLFAIASKRAKIMLVRNDDQDVGMIVRGGEVETGTATRSKMSKARNATFIDYPNEWDGDVSWTACSSCQDLGLRKLRYWRLQAMALTSKRGNTSPRKSSACPSEV